MGHEMVRGTMAGLQVGGQSGEPWETLNRIKPSYAIICSVSVSDKLGDLGLQFPDVSSGGNNIFF